MPYQPAHPTHQYWYRQCAPGDGQHVDRLLGCAELLYGFVDFLVARVVETFRLEDVADGGVGVFLKHQRAEDGLFHLKVTRGYAPLLLKELLLYAFGVGIAVAAGIFGLLLFWHNDWSLTGMGFRGFRRGWRMCRLAAGRRSVALCSATPRAVTSVRG